MTEKMTQEIVLLDRPTPTLADLDHWGPADAAEVASGDPVQHGRAVHHDEQTGLSVGSWHSTPYSSPEHFYAVDEFMYLIEGSVSILHEDGAALVVREGESFFVPKGLRCRWVQEEPVLKHFVIYDDGSPAKEHHSPELRARKLGGDPAFAGSQPIADGRDPAAGYKSRSGRFEVLRWTSEEAEGIPLPRGGIDTFVHVASGDLIIGDPNDPAGKLGTGQSAFIPRGAAASIEGTGPVVAVFCLFA